MPGYKVTFSLPIMGSYYSTQNWYIYSRDLESDGWNKEPLYENEKECFGRFKHLVYRFALQETPDFKSYKTIYMYNGSNRIAKAELIRPDHDDFYKMELEFTCPDTASKWDTCDEQIINQQTLWRETEFNKVYVSLPCDEKFKRRWQLVKSLTAPQKSPMLSVTDYLNYSGVDINV